jgi:hypothetical protein
MYLVIHLIDVLQNEAAQESLATYEAVEKMIQEAFPAPASGSFR